jgi:hypothetical protein
MRKSSPSSVENPEALILERLALAEARRRGLLNPERGPASALSRIRTDPAEIFTASGRTPDDWQANLLRSTSKQMLLLCSRQAGKSTVAAALAIKAALTQTPALVLLLSPVLRQSGELFRDKVKRFYNDLGRPVAVVQESQLAMELANGSRIISLPGDEGTIRGYSGVSLLVIDEASRVPDDLYRAVRPMLAVSKGNLVCLTTPWGKQGWFHKEWHGGGDWERVRITAEECPRISGEFLEEERRSMGESWYRQEYMCSFEDAGGSPLFLPGWLDRAASLARDLAGKPRRAKAIGCDPGEGVSSTVWVVVDELGVIAVVSEKTADTSVIVGKTAAMIKEYGVEPGRVVFDRGGGGKQHADLLESKGCRVRTVGFGEAVTAEPSYQQQSVADRIGQRSERYSYVNRRAQLYGQLRLLLNPAHNERGFAIPAEFGELRRQLSPMPLLYDGEGRMRMLPKNKKDPEGKERTLQEILGVSPDEADALVLAVDGLQNETRKVKVGAW